MTDRQQIESQRQALADAESEFGPDHLQTVQAAFQLAIFRRHDGPDGTVEAEALAMRVIDIHARNPELDQSYLAGPLSMLGSIRHMQGRRSESEALLRRAIELQVDEETGEDDPFGDDELKDLGIDLLEQGRFVEAAEFLNRALAVTEKTMGSDYPFLGSHLRLLAEANIGLKQFDEAIELLQRERALLLKHTPEEIDTHGDILELIADCHEQAGCPEAADERLQEAYKLRVQSDRELYEKYGQGKRHDTTRQASENLILQAKRLAKRGRIQEAIVLVEQIAAHRAEFCTSPVASHSGLWQMLGKWYVKVGRFAEAESHLKQSREYYESQAVPIEELQRQLVEQRSSPTWRPGSRIKPLDHANVSFLGDIEHNLGLVYHAAGRFDDALRAYERFRSGRSRMRPTPAMSQPACSTWAWLMRSAATGTRRASGSKRGWRSSDKSNRKASLFPTCCHISRRCVNDRADSTRPPNSFCPPPSCG